MTNTIVPNLWFDHNANEAVGYYISVFPDSKVITTAYYPKEGLEEFQKEFAGKELSIDFELSGNRFTAINAGSEFKLSEAVSFAVYCKDQKEINYFWEKLSAVPESEQCGWCKDKFGLSWQIVPTNIEELMNKPGSFATMMKQKKIIISEY